MWVMLKPLRVDLDDLVKVSQPRVDLGPLEETLTEIVTFCNQENEARHEMSKKLKTIEDRLEKTDEALRNRPAMPVPTLGLPQHAGHHHDGHHHHHHDAHSHQPDTLPHSLSHDAVGSDPTQFPKSPRSAGDTHHRGSLHRGSLEVPASSPSPRSGHSERARARSASHATRSPRSPRSPRMDEEESMQMARLSVLEISAQNMQENIASVDVVRLDQEVKDLHDKHERLDQVTRDIDSKLHKLRAEQQQDNSDFTTIKQQLGDVDVQKISRHVKELMLRQSQDEADASMRKQQLESLLDSVAAMQKEIGDVRHHSAGVDFQKVLHTQALHTEQLKELLGRLCEQEHLSEESFNNIDKLYEELSKAAEDREQRLRKATKVATDGQNQLEILQEKMKGFTELSALMQELKTEIPELKVARHELMALQRTVDELQNSQVSLQALEALKNQVVEQGQTDVVIRQQTQELSDRMSKSEKRFEDFAQSLLAMHQVLGEHALDLQWLFTQARWMKASLDEVQQRSFVKLPTRPESPPRLQFVKVSAQGIPNLPPLSPEVYTLGAMKWNATEESNGNAPPLTKSTSDTTFGSKSKHSLGRPLSASSVRKARTSTMG